MGVCECERACVCTLPLGGNQQRRCGDDGGAARLPWRQQLQGVSGVLSGGGVDLEETAGKSEHPTSRSFHLPFRVQFFFPGLVSHDLPQPGL